MITFISESGYGQLLCSLHVVLYVTHDDSAMNNKFKIKVTKYIPLLLLQRFLYI